jgi:integrase
LTPGGFKLDEQVSSEATRLTLAHAAKMMREAVKDKSYRATPLGLEVAHFMRWFRNEYGATSETLRDYEAILSKLAIDHADLALADFEPPIGTTRLREFIDARWGESAARTRKKVRSVLMSFFKWAQGEFKVHGNPVVAIRTPRLRDVERELFASEDIMRIVEAQPELRDRVALKLLFLMGLRKSELAAVRFRDFDLGRRRLRVHGKGGKIRQTPIPTEQLREEIATLSLRRDQMEHLLYPQKRGPGGSAALGGPSQGALGACDASLVVQVPLTGWCGRGRRHEWQEDARSPLHGGDGVLPCDGRHLRNSAAARARRRQHDGEHLRPGLTRRSAREARPRVGRVVRTTVSIDAVSAQLFRSNSA